MPARSASTTSVAFNVKEGPTKPLREMIKLYWRANGFGWKMDEIIGVQIVSVPMSLPLSMANETFQSLVKWLAGNFAGIVLVGNLAALAAVSRNIVTVQRSKEPQANIDKFFPMIQRFRDLQRSAGWGNLICPSARRSRHDLRQRC